VQKYAFAAKVSFLEPSPTDEKVPRPSAAQWGVALLALAVAAGVVSYRWLVQHRLQQSAALFVGIPTIVCIVLAFTPSPKTVAGMAVKAITIGLLLSGPLLQEGFLCILMAAPLFYLIGIGLGSWIDRERSQPPGSRLYVSAAVVVPFIAMSLEGTHPILTIDDNETVVASKVLEMSPRAFGLRLAGMPDFGTKLPAFLGIGFPRPLSASGEGLAPGDERSIHFSGGEGRPPGDVRLTVEESRDGFARFRCSSDTSHVTHWLAWQGSVVEWREASPGRTHVTWSLRYRRLLSPWWYFGPLERYAARLAAGYLIDTFSVAERDRDGP
jgi:hypothetical protein